MDDVRGSRALALAELLIAGDASSLGYDPVAAEAAGEVLPSLQIAADPYEAAEGAVVHRGLRRALGLHPARPGRLRSIVASPMVVDGRNNLDGACSRRQVSCTCRWVPPRSAEADDRG